ncbi:MAG TPA: LysR family transcriptional regulator [Candidatus Anaerotruncus excrementipullorum]|uniref:LysR family transcriptional regulator n=1 Tax=Candidatus Anaerotruncus excrementipullorum TaxID=2838465 RepID=A0A9D2B8Q8_9FIRM|nr:LysR family transcriptional regulator [Candidatus Anaerotruncus excrementipullorum]
MELKQLEFFMTACDCGSLGKAAEQLYTTQPNVSKVISSLERELGKPLFERTSRGLKLTDYGKSIHQYADNILKNVELITHSGRTRHPETLSVSSYPSHVLVSVLVDLYKKDPTRIIEHRQDTVEGITNHVARGISELGILYVSQKQRMIFQHIIAHKNLEFVTMGIREACIYVGPHNPLFYGKGSVSLKEVYQLRFIRGLSDYFSMEHHLKQVNMGAIDSEKLHPAIYTNSEHFSMDLLQRTDLAELGIDINPPALPQSPENHLRCLRIEGEEANLILGYVVAKEHALSDIALELVEGMKAQLNASQKS